MIIPSWQYVDEFSTPDPPKLLDQYSLVTLEQEQITFGNFGGEKSPLRYFNFGNLNLV